MEHAYKEAVQPMPNEERIDKVSIMSTHNHHCVNKNKTAPSFVSWWKYVPSYFQVQESMENLEEVVRERNRAYFELEAGVSGERERVIRQGN